MSCPAGQISSSGASFCTVCEQGEFAADDHQTCLACPAGFACSVGIKANYCDGNGEFSPAKASVCSTATAGHRPSLNRTSQEPCPANMYSLGANDTCTACESGGTHFRYEGILEGAAFELSQQADRGPWGRAPRL